MLELKNIRKIYETGDTKLAALDGVSLCFRENEFVSILGPSGCGKTTLLNIVGGLDRYTEGDLIINGRSTKSFRDKDWDTYRNHSIGFVFQSYNLIPHQTVLANVELALTLSGVSKSERRAKATEALEKVGLGNQLHKKPNQMSGGQMQRVAIARALVNNPDILLADEPTGALDTQTSVQIMDLLKEVAKDRLVIMVTHNPELAEQYSTRIVRFSDGKVIGDTNPLTSEEYQALLAKEEAALIEAKKNKKLSKAQAKKKSMSFGTAISLSFKNLLTKKGRTILTSFAGSIGIIGIALILSLSNGINLFIQQVQEDTLSTYPLSIQKETSDTSAMLSAMTNVDENDGADRDPNKIYVDDSMSNMINAMLSTRPNNLVKFKEYVDSNYDEKLAPYVSDIQYTYDLNLQAFSVIPTEKDSNKNRVTKLGLGSMLDNMGEEFEGMSSLINSSGMLSVMSEMLDNQELLEQQYELVSGEWPTKENEMVLVVSKDNQISRMTLYMLGLLDQEELDEIMAELMTNKQVESEPVEPFAFEDLLGLDFYFVNTSDFFEKTDKKYPTGEDYYIWEDVRERADYNEEKFITENGMKLKISAIIRPRVDASATSISTPLAYTRKLTDKILALNAESEIIKQQKETPTINVTNGRPHDLEEKEYTVENINELFDTFDANTMSKISSMFGSMIAGTFAETPETGVDPATGLPTNPKLTNFIMYSILLSNEQKLSLASSLYDKAVEIAPTQVPALFMILSKDGVFNIDSKEDLMLCLPSIAQNPEQFGTLIGFLTNICKDNMQPFYDTMQTMLPTIALSKSDCVTYIKGFAEQEKNMTAEDASQEGLDMSTEDVIALLKTMAPESDATLKSTLKKLGDAEKASPASINFYAKDFASKEKIEQFITDYNNSVENEEDAIEYTDLVGALMSSVTIIINVISYVLIAFVSISLVVSSIMIGIITNISVLERTKEIGILRAIGASKKDVSRVFNAETFIIGLIAGLLGILITVLLCIPANAIIFALTGFANIKAVLPPVAAVILIIISMGLTMLAGIIPAKSASKKDPVVALRTE
ncbi:MAG: ABC transporter ATP-binding protein/permease [Ruminococcaceae bacterium]|nr:ABC transporter ATP-binding protein/permease [Oscillospiraceae bacterium]